MLVKDLGGGALVDLASSGIAGEPTVRACVDAGADLVCFSTDKVLGGPQGGAIVGKFEWVEKARRDPLARALRIGRLPLAALEATLACYLEGVSDEVPALAALLAPLEQVRARAQAWCAWLDARGVSARVVEIASAVGGGACAEQPVASAGIAIECAGAERIAAHLRREKPAVLGRIHEGALLFDARTVLPGEDDVMLKAVVRGVLGTTA